MVTPQPWHQQYPIDVEKFINYATALEGYLRNRATSRHQQCLVGQLTYLRRNLADFSDKPLPGHRPTGKLRKYLRDKMLERDNYTCQICHQPDLPLELLEMHHITPLSAGGTNKLENLITHCRDCHQSLHNTP